MQIFVTSSSVTQWQSAKRKQLLLSFKSSRICLPYVYHKCIRNYARDNQTACLLRTYIHSPIQLSTRARSSLPAHIHIEWNKANHAFGSVGAQITGAERHPTKWMDNNDRQHWIYKNKQMKKENIYFSFFFIYFYMELQTHHEFIPLTKFESSRRKCIVESLAAPFVFMLRANASSSSSFQVICISEYVTYGCSVACSQWVGHRRFHWPQSFHSSSVFSSLLRYTRRVRFFLLFFSASKTSQLQSLLVVLGVMRVLSSRHTASSHRSSAIAFRSCYSIYQSARLATSAFSAFVSRHCNRHQWVNIMNKITRHQNENPMKW